MSHVWPVLHDGVTPLKQSNAENFQFEPVAMGTQVLGVLQVGVVHEWVPESLRVVVGAGV